MGATRGARRPGRILRSLWAATRSRVVRAHPSPLFVLGNQKSGTSAIAALLAHATGSTLTQDIRRAIDDPAVQLRLRFGLESMDTFVERHRHEFSRQIVKEPALTLFYGALRRRFPESRFVFVVRDPRQNIRSILDRLGIAGSLETLDLDSLAVLARSPAWRLVLDPAWLGHPGDHYIEGLAHRWCHMADVCLANRDHLILVRYEDFIRDKRGTIEALASRCVLPVVADVTRIADAQYQPRGNAGVDPMTFFGSRNLERIVAICVDRMHQLGYLAGNSG
jgi:Sulfotransferase family